MSVRFHVDFELDGIPGRETFQTGASGLAAFADVQEQFWGLVEALGARTVEPARSAWDYLPIVHGPTLRFLTRGDR